MLTRILSGILSGFVTNFIIRLVPSSVISLTGIVLAGLLGIQYFRRRKFDRAVPSLPGNSILNHFQLRLNPDLLLEKSREPSKQHGKVFQFSSLRLELPWYRNFTSLRSSEDGNLLNDICNAICCDCKLYTPFRSIKDLNEEQTFEYRRCVLSDFTRNLLFISDLEVAKGILQSKDRKYREKPMLGWIEPVEASPKKSKLIMLSEIQLESNVPLYFHPGEPFDLWLSERREIRKKYRCFSLEQSSIYQMKKFDGIILSELETLVSRSIKQSSGLSRSDVMLLTTNTLMEYLCGRRFHSGNERFKRFLDEIDRLHENFVLRHVYLRGISEIVYHSFWYKRQYRERAEKAYHSANYIRQFLESDAGLIEMRENMREMYPDGSYPDETDLNFAQVLIKNYLENPEKVSWDGCVKTIASIVSNASPISNMIMASLGYLSLDGASQSSIYDEIFQKFGENRARYLTVEESMKLAALRAVLMETCRMISSPPVLFIASEKTSINGHHVAKGTRIFLNIEQMNHSTELWEESETFKPGRFLTASEKDPQAMIIKRPPAYLPYNFGRKSQAMMSLLEHIASNFLANIVDRFRIDSSQRADEMARSGLGSYRSIDMKNFFTVNLWKRT